LNVLKRLPFEYFTIIQLLNINKLLAWWNNNEWQLYCEVVRVLLTVQTSSKSLQHSPWTKQL